MAAGTDCGTTRPVCAAMNVAEEKAATNTREVIRDIEAPQYELGV
jgi:hypothetical protein